MSERMIEKRLGGLERTVGEHKVDIAILNKSVENNEKKIDRLITVHEQTNKYLNDIRDGFAALRGGLKASVWAFGTLMSIGGIIVAVVTL